MRPKHIFAILLLGSLGLIVVLFLRSAPEGTVAAAAPTVAQATISQDEVLVAARPLPAGLLLRAQDVTWRVRELGAGHTHIVRPSVEARNAKPESDEAARATVYGAALRGALGEGQAIRVSGIVRPGDRDFLQTVLAPTARALTIPIPAAGGGPGLMFPGDHVDVMLTQTFKDADAPLTRRSVSETVVEKVRVLAIESNAKAPSGSAAGALNVTLEVLSQQAEKINVAQELGKLSLTLRGQEDAAPSEPGTAAVQPSPAPASAPTWAGDVSPALTSTIAPPKPAQVEKPNIKVMRGPNAVDTTAR